MVWIHRFKEVLQRHLEFKSFTKSFFFFFTVDDMDRITIENGMQDISSGTCIKFLPRTHEGNFLDIQPRYGWVWLLLVAFAWFFIFADFVLWRSHMSFLFCAPSCWSFLGQTGGSQTLSLQTPGCIWSGVAAHELMHALGFVHEQSRSDRDHYVSIVWKNIMQGQDERSPSPCVLLHSQSLFFIQVSNFSRQICCVSFVFYVLTDQMHNFRKQVTNNLNSPYDYGSVMHYGRWAALWGNIFIAFARVSGASWSLLYAFPIQICLLWWWWTNNNPQTRSLHSHWPARWTQYSRSS